MDTKPKPTTKPWYESKIIIIASLSALTAAAGAIESGGDWRMISVAVVMAVLAALRRWFTTQNLTALVVVLSLGAVGCTAASKAMWGRVVRGATDVAVDAACASLAAKCSDKGGAVCIKVVTEGCHMGRPYIGKLVDQIFEAKESGLAASVNLDPSAIQDECSKAFEADPGLKAYRVRMAQ